MSEKEYGLGGLQVERGEKGQPGLLFTHARRAPRSKIGEPVDLELYLEDGELWSRGEGTVADISAVGIRLTDVQFDRPEIPISDYSVHVSFRGGKSEGIQADGRPVRIQPGRRLTLSLDLTSFSVQIEHEARVKDQTTAGTKA